MRSKRILRLIQASALLGMSIFIFSCQKTIQQEDQSLHVLDDVLSEYKLIDLDVASHFSQVAGKFDQDVEFTFDEHTYSLTEESIVSDDHAFYRLNEDGSTTKEDLHEIHYLSNTRAGGSTMFVVSETSLRGEFVQGNIEYVVLPLSDYLTEDKSGRYILHRKDAFIGEDTACESIAANAIQGEGSSQAGTNSLGSASFMAAKRCRVNGLAEKPFYNIFGGNVTNLYDYMFYNVATANSRYSASAMPVDIIWGTVWYDPWGTYSPPNIYDTNSKAYAWKDWANGQSWLVKNDAMILWAASMANHGVAFVGTSCVWPGWQYGIVRHISTSYRHSVLAHELGHLMGATHFDSYANIMHSATTGNNFVTTSKNQVTNHVNAYSCYND